MKQLQHKFVDCMPQPLEDGILYVSIRFGIVSHNCPCGCGNEVVTNISPRGWQLTYDGESISLYPSIGNWDFKCRSHYWITRNRVLWAARWSDKRINQTKELENYSGSESGTGNDKKTRGKKKNIWSRIIGRPS